MSSSSRTGASRLARTMRSLLVMAAIGGVLAALNIWTTHRDVGLATGPTGTAQREFFRKAAERPDLELFYKALTHEERMRMAQRLGAYDDPEIAAVVVKLLGTFDAEARKALQDSLVKMAESRPPSVVDQLSAAGSFQQLAISKAVQTVGPSAIDLVAAKLKDDASRTNASALLVDLGPSVVPAVLPLLGDSTEAVRLAAVDVLGKLRVEESVPKLIELYEGSKGDEKLGYLSALSSIGDGRAEPLLTAAFRDERLSVPTRSQAALGLGRIGSETSVQLLAQAVDSPDRQLRESVLSGLVLAGDPSLAGSVLPKDVRLVVAGGIDSARADAAIRDALLTQPTVEAADAAIGRPKLASALAQALERTQDGVVLDRLMRALTTTAEGKDRLKAFESHPTLGGLASRRVQIGAG